MGREHTCGELCSLSAEYVRGTAEIDGMTLCCGGSQVQVSLDFIRSRKPVKVTDKAVGYTTIFI